MEEARRSSLARLVLLLHLKHGAGLGEHWQWTEEGDQGRLLSETVVKTAHQRVKERPIGHHLSKLA